MCIFQIYKECCFVTFAFVLSWSVLTAENSAPILFVPKGYSTFQSWFIYCDSLSLYLLEFDLPTYSITPSAHPIKCPPQCLSPSHPHPPHPPLLLLLLVRFPELGVSHGLSSSLQFPHSVSLLSLIVPFTISYIPHMSETI